jgi:hypothetical protein
MRVILTGEELSGIADRLTQRLESTLKAAMRKEGEVRQPISGAAMDGTFLRQVRRGLAQDLAPIVCPEDTLLTAEQARTLMGIKKSKWHMLRSEARIPDPVPTICGDRWYRSMILGCMTQAGEADDGERNCGRA